ncbi:MAG: hypothetical protein U0271_08750 [Polyangiaceae bacterium]
MFPADVAPVFTNCADPRVVLVVVPMGTLNQTARDVERTLSAAAGLTLSQSPAKRGEFALEVSPYGVKYFSIDSARSMRGAVAARCADAETCRAVAGAMRAADPKFAPAWFCGVPPATLGEWRPPRASKVRSPR